MKRLEKKKITFYFLLLFSLCYSFIFSLIYALFLSTDNESILIFHWFLWLTIHLSYTLSDTFLSLTTLAHLALLSAVSRPSSSFHVVIPVTSSCHFGLTTMEVIWGSATHWYIIASVIVPQAGHHCRRWNRRSPECWRTRQPFPGW